MSVKIGEATPDFGPELSISPRYVLVATAVLGLLFALGVEFASCPFEVVDPVVSLFLLVLALVTVGWILAGWKPRLAKWYTIFMLIGTVHLVSAWLHLSASLSFAAIPIALAVPLISLPAATAIAVAESMFLALLLNHASSGFDSSAAAAAILAVWCFLGVIWAVYHPVLRVSKWLGGYYSINQRLLNEARDRKAEMEEIVRGLTHANRQLALASQRTAALRTLAEEAQRAKTAFVANVSHEFRTPLNMIIGLVELMVETPERYAVVLSPKMRKDMETVHRNCIHLSNMVNDVLDLTRIDSGRMALHREQVDLKEIVKSSVAAVLPLVEERQLTLDVLMPADLPVFYCDRTRVEQVILNLLSNAARFTEKGGIRVEASVEDRYVLVRVTDTGSGMSSDAMAGIFEPFWQPRGQLWRDKGGSGLGLSISKQFIRLHGGDMWVESELARGTTFFFTLPLSQPIEHVVHPGYAIREDWAWREHMFHTDRTLSVDQLVKPRVVICDETGNLFHWLARYYTEIEFIDTRSPVQALQELQEHMVHALLLNAVDPAGLRSLTEVFRRETPGTLVVGCSVKPEVEFAVAAGALGYLTKPVTRVDLEMAIRSVGVPLKRILLVDDDPDFLYLFKEILLSHDNAFDITTASSGSEALEQIHRELPDLVLLDIVMSDMSGWEVLKSISGAHDGEVKVPVFLVSAQDAVNRLPESEFLFVTQNRGLTLNSVVRCLQGLPSLLSESQEVLGRAPV